MPDDADSPGRAVVFFYMWSILCLLVKLCDSQPGADLHQAEFGVQSVEPNYSGY